MVFATLSNIPDHASVSAFREVRAESKGDLLQELGFYVTRAEGHCPAYEMYSGNLFCFSGTCGEYEVCGHDTFAILREVSCRGIYDRNIRIRRYSRFIFSCYPRNVQYYI